MTIESIPIRVDDAGGRARWLQLRQQDVTASVGAALFGVHPYMTRYRLWHEKAGKLAPDQAETAAMIRGRVLEAPAIELLRIERPNWKIVQPNVYLRDIGARLGATPDAYALDPSRGGLGVVQVKSVEKSVFARSWRNEAGDVEPPLWIVVQAIQEAHLASASWACVIALVIGFGIELHIIDIPIHAGTIERLRSECAAFWQSIAEGEPPAPHYEADAETIVGLYREDNGREIDLTGDNMLPVILDERAELMTDMKRAKDRIETINTEIAAKLGEHERGYLPGWIIKRPLIHRKAYSVAATTYRRLTVKELA